MKLVHTPRRFQILVIEDSQIDALLIQKMLRDGPDGTSFSIAIESTLTNGLARASECHPDLVLLDLSLPDSRDLDTLHTLQTYVNDIPVVVLTGTEDEALAEKALVDGAQDYLVKGNINAQALQRVLRYAIQRHRFNIERRSLEHQLAQSRKLEAIGQLAAGIAHEINTPTQYVSDNTRFLRDAFQDLVATLDRLRISANEEQPLLPADLKTVLAEADIDYLLEEIPRAVDQSLDGLARITRIVRAMKQFSHPAQGEKTPTDLNKALETTLIVARNEWKYVAEVATEFDPELPAVACLPGELNQVFLNLIVNAAQAITEIVASDNGAKGRITVGTRALPDGLAEIRITDTGCGVAPENRQKVFDPFFTTKDVDKGTGQGLAIAYGIVVKKHGGTIDFESTPGQGTCFFIRLPIAGSKGASASPSAPPSV